MKSIIFDMDGVIFDTESLTFELWKRVAKQYDFPGIETLYPSFIGKSRAGIISLLTDKFGETFPFSEMIEQVSNLLHDTIDRNGPPLMPYAPEALSYLQNCGYHIALASSTPTDLIMKELSMVKLVSYFQVIIGGDQVLRGKPSPDIFLKACEGLGSPPQNTYVVEDSENGVRAAYAANTKVIMIPDMIKPSSEIRGMCFKILPNLNSIMEILK